MSQALYRKWRPARFNEVVGQEHVTGTLQQATAAGRIGHAYLFSGPRGTGKTTTARLVAKAANCLNEDLSQRPCNVCAPCLAVNDGRFLDLIEIDAASNTGVDDIRDLRDKISFSPGEGRYKVYIIDEVHMLSTAAFNALLKTLEEPPAHAIFILATTEEHKVPLTIKSRCQLFNFRLLTTQETITRLRWLTKQEQITVEPEALAMIARHGAGSMRDAESLLDQLVFAPGDIITLERAQKVLGTASSQAVWNLTDAWQNGDGQAGLQVIHEALATGADPRQFARQMVAYLRQLLLLQAAGHEMEIDAYVELRQEMIRQARELDRRSLIDAVKRFNEAATTRTASWLPQLSLELAFIELLSDQAIEARLALPAHSSEIQTNTAAEVADPPTEPPQVYQERLQPESIAEDQGILSDARTEPIIEDERDRTIELEQVVKRWPKLREILAQKSPTLLKRLASGKPLAVEGAALVLGFDYEILKGKFDREKDAKPLIEDILSELLNSRISLRTVVTANYRPAQRTEVNRDDFVALAKELGGVVQDQE